jgi:hypothetical protein
MKSLVKELSVRVLAVYSQVNKLQSTLMLQKPFTAKLNSADDMTFSHFYILLSANPRP